uniref:Uncharacterized protein n=1 Tax=viral metagenome TaxID=1070528 RepID=A0A6C0H8K2_9ZZZZ
MAYYASGEYKITEYYESNQATPRSSNNQTSSNSRTSNSSNYQSNQSTPQSSNNQTSSNSRTSTSSNRESSQLSTLELLTDSLQLIIKDPNNHMMIVELANYAKLLANSYNTFSRQPNTIKIINAINKHIRNLALEIKTIANNS